LGVVISLRYDFRGVLPGVDWMCGRVLAGGECCVIFGKGDMTSKFSSSKWSSVKGSSGDTRLACLVGEYVVLVIDLVGNSTGTGCLIDERQGVKVAVSIVDGS
jgi:hypothetical protein